MIRVQGARDDAAIGEVKLVQGMDVQSCNRGERASTVSGVEGNRQPSRVGPSEGRGHCHLEEDLSINGRATKEQGGLSDRGVALFVLTTLFTVREMRGAPYLNFSHELTINASGRGPQGCRGKG